MFTSSNDLIVSSSFIKMVNSDNVKCNVSVLWKSKYIIIALCDLKSHVEQSSLSIQLLAKYDEIKLYALFVRYRSSTVCVTGTTAIMSVLQFIHPC